ncbi:MAG TPA: gephyrin-like molybdotransferase Glp, partial [Terriglobia bacterium]|nr:gephyrin-like molybdotransferase Glp [Terriglobia bacterium]
IERGVAIVMDLVAELARPDRMPAESVPLTESMHRILREDVMADSDSPRFDKAIRDGFAVRYEDLSAIPADLRVIGESRAGHSAAAGTNVTSSTCCEIMTGAAMPAGANAVVMVEHTERLSPDRVRVLRSVREGEGLMRLGVEMRQGDRILTSGKKILLADIGTLANVGKAHVVVSKRPRVAILATGDELVEVLENPDTSRIRNSNSYSLHAQVTEAGAEPVMLGIARDNLPDLREKIRLGLEHDIVLVSGGVSMGKYDFVEEVFAEFGVKILFDQVAMKPGKPTVFGHRGDTFVFGLPGNPVSTMVAFRMFVRPLILKLLKAEDTASTNLEAELDVATRRDPSRTAIVPALVRFEERRYRIRTAPWKGSSDLAGLSRANALVVIPHGEGMIEAGEWVEFFSIE